MSYHPLLCLFLFALLGFLDDYIDGGTKIEGGYHILTCHPEWEAATFSSCKHNAMESIKKINLKLHQS